MKEISKEELAKILDKGNSSKVITDELEELAKENDLVIVYIEKDTLILKGTIEEKCYIYDTDNLGLYMDGELIHDIGTGEVYKNTGDGLTRIADEDTVRAIRVKRNPTNSNLIWEISSTIPNSTFIITEDNKPSIRGMIIDINEMTGRKASY